MASRATNAACSGDEDEEVLYEAPLATVVTYDQTGLVTSVTGILGVLKHKKMNITRILLRLQLGGFIAFKKNLLTGDQFHLDYKTIRWSRSDHDQPKEKFTLILDTTQQARELEKIMSSNRTPAPQRTKAPTPGGTAKKSQVKREAPNFRKGDELVTFLIGKDQRKYLVHKSFACYYSPVLNAAFTGSFIEGQTQTYILEDTTPDSFERFVNWLYTQKIEAYKEGENVGIFFRITAQLYVLAQKFLIPRLQNCVLDAIENARSVSGYIPTFQIVYAWESTPSESPLRRLLLHYCSHNLRASRYWEIPEHFPKDMLLDLATLFRDMTQEKKVAGSPDMKDFYVEEEEGA